MLKTLTIVLALTAIGAGSAANAQACGGGCCMSMSHSGMNMAPSKPDEMNMDGMEMPPAPASPSAARSTRRYSYEPSMRSYSAPRTRSFRSSPNSLPKSDPGRYNF